MPKIEYTITDPNGIHARPAGRIVSVAKRYTSEIHIYLPEKSKTADAKKLFAVMGLGVVQGNTVIIEAQGDDADAALQAIQKEMQLAGL